MTRMHVWFYALVLGFVGSAAFIGWASITPTLAAPGAIAVAYQKPEAQNPLADGLDRSHYTLDDPTDPDCSYYEEGDYRAGQIHGFVVIQFCTEPHTTHPDYGAWRAAIAAGDFKRVIEVEELKPGNVQYAEGSEQFIAAAKRAAEAQR